VLLGREPVRLRHVAPAFERASPAVGAPFIVVIAELGAAADLAHSPDARAGLATAVFTPSPVDDTYVLLTITYVNGVSEKTGILNMIAMGDPSSWRMQIGTAVNPVPPPLGRAQLPE
jgi:hypothetical protein